MATVYLPLHLKQWTGGTRQVEVSGATLAEVIGALDRLYPGLGAQIADGQQLVPSLRATVDGRIAPLGLRTPVEPTSEVCLLPALGGG